MAFEPRMDTKGHELRDDGAVRLLFIRVDSGPIAAELKRTRCLAAVARPARRRIVAWIRVAAIALAVSAPAMAQPAGRTDPATVLGARRGSAGFSRDLAVAWQEYSRSDLAAAKSRFNHVATSPKTPPDELCEALLGLGWCRQFQRPIPDETGAIRAFTSIVEEHPADSLAPWALIELGNLHLEKGRPGQDEARVYFQQVIDRYSSSPAVHEAVLRLANSLFYELKPAKMEQGAALLERHLRQHPDNPLAVIMHFRLDYYYGDIRLEFAKALPHAIYVAEQKLSDPFRWSRQYWHVAEILRLRLGRPVEAARWYRRLVEECPDSEQALSAAEILAGIEKTFPAAKGRR